MGNCTYILDEVALLCQNPGLPPSERHRHIHLVAGRADRTRMYPVPLIHAILRGLKRFLRKNAELGAMWVLAAGEMGPTLDEEPPTPEPLKWQPLKAGAFYDEKTGLELPRWAVEKGHHTEMDFLDQLKVWDVRLVSECLSVTGRKPISLRWVEENKSGVINPEDEGYEIRSRLVVQETKRVSTIDPMDHGAVFSGMAPLEALRMLCSEAMSNPWTPTQVE